VTAVNSAPQTYNSGTSRVSYHMGGWWWWWWWWTIYQFLLFIHDTGKEYYLQIKLKLVFWQKLKFWCP